ncbi:Electron transport complex subunit RsxB [bioreactor metagenome]|uniref:Electron transport complex subunit RsxB n=1 Tax=bioreactor metagenome TaxID=1076179 RepID=A0A644V049_9ZZZZ
MQIINTRKVNCKDCHRCLRSCPVKAIGISQGRARVLDDKCILCGKCVAECPRHAKRLTTHLPAIKEAIASERKVVMSLATSFVGIFDDYTPSQLMSSIKALGFAAVEESAIGAQILALLYRSLLKDCQKTIISSSCPVIVNMVKKYYPELVDNLAPIVSPMMANGLLLKQKYGEDAFVVFAGSCMAKFAEQTEKCDKHAVDAVITFSQLRQWLKYAKISPEIVPYVPKPLGNARYFPVAGGVLKSFMNHDTLDTEIIAVDGIEKCMEVFESLVKKEITPRFIEAFSCVGGCIGGPASGSSQSIPVRRLKVIEFANQFKGQATLEIPQSLDFTCKHLPTPVINPEPSEMDIKKILQQIGKFTKVDEKNCGACGYNTCREKASAVFQGVAEIDMCIPYMRSKAESFANIIVENSIMGIIVLDNKMVIQDINPAFKRMFVNAKTMLKGDSLTEVLDCSDFVTAANQGQKVVSKRVEYHEYNLVTEQMIMPVTDHGLVIVVISDVTEQEKRAKDWEQMKEETVEKATDIINKQMHVAQEIAGLLGETTAETKSALLELMWLLKGREEK